MKRFCVWMLLGALLSGCATAAPTETIASPTPFATIIPTPEIALTATYEYMANPDLWPDPCNPPDDYEEYFPLHGGATAYVVTWQDLNQNAVIDEDEPPLGEVSLTTIANYGSGLTDARGEGTIYTFAPGCLCDCWQGDIVSVQEIPKGYYLTTPIRYELTGDEQTYYFGFAPIPPEILAEYADEPEWVHNFWQHGLYVHEFHYDESSSKLTLRVEGTLGANSAEDVYWEIFLVLKDLEETMSLFSDMEITIAPSTTTYTCAVEDFLRYELVHPDWGEYSLDRIVEENCTPSE